MSELEYIEDYPIKKIKPYERNARKNDAAVPVLINAMQTLGNNDPIEVNEEGVILAGHTRYKALKEQGCKTARVIVVKGLTEEQQRAYRLEHNKTNEIAQWDEEILMEELSGIEDIDMTKMGFQERQLSIDVEEDDFEPEIEDDPISKVGDVYILGNHVLIVGDATNRKDIEKLVKTGGGVVDMIMTDPPYNVAIEGGTHDKLTIMNDNIGDTEFASFLEQAFKNANEFLKEGGAFYIWYAIMNDPQFTQACKNAGWQIRQKLIWVKSHLSLGRADYQWKHEPCLYGWKDGAGHYFTESRNLVTTIEEELQDLDKLTKDDMRKLLEKILSSDIPVDVIHADKPMRNADHPTMKPVKMLAQLIQNSSRRGETVLDMFGGSGSTMIACEQIDRRCLMSELDPRYADVIIKRWEEFTGKKAVKIEG